MLVLESNASKSNCSAMIASEVRHAEILVAGGLQGAGDADDAD